MRRDARSERSGRFEWLRRRIRGDPESFGRRFGGNVCCTTLAQAGKYTAMAEVKILKTWYMMRQ
jgi:hypothetical protein